MVLTTSISMTTIRHTLGSAKISRRGRFILEKRCFFQSAHWSLFQIERKCFKMCWYEKNYAFNSTVFAENIKTPQNTITNTDMNTKPISKF